MPDLVAIDRVIINRIFDPVANNIRNWIGVDQWQLSRECAIGSTVLSMLSLGLGYQKLAWWLIVLIALGNVTFLHIQLKTIRALSGEDMGWAIARVSEMFARWFFNGALIASLIINLFAATVTWITICNEVSLLLGVGNFYFRCVFMLPPPPPKREMQLARATAS